MPVVDPRQGIEAQLISRALKDESFKQRLLKDPNAAKAEMENLFGRKLPEDFKVKVLEETVDTAYLVLPATVQLTDAQLETMKSGVNITLPCTMGSITLS